MPQDNIYIFAFDPSWLMVFPENDQQKTIITDGKKYLYKTQVNDKKRKILNSWKKGEDNRQIPKFNYRGTFTKQRGFGFTKCSLDRCTAESNPEEISKEIFNHLYEKLTSESANPSKKERKALLKKLNFLLHYISAEHGSMYTFIAGSVITPKFLQMSKSSTWEYSSTQDGTLSLESIEQDENNKNKFYFTFTQKVIFQLPNSDNSKISGTLETRYFVDVENFIVGFKHAKLSLNDEVAEDLKTHFEDLLKEIQKLQLIWRSGENEEESKTKKEEPGTEEIIVERFEETEKHPSSKKFIFYSNKIVGKIRRQLADLIKKDVSSQDSSVTKNAEKEIRGRIKNLVEQILSVLPTHLTPDKKFLEKKFATYLKANFEKLTSTEAKTLIRELIANLVAIDLLPVEMIDKYIVKVGKEELPDEEYKKLAIQLFDLKKANIYKKLMRNKNKRVRHAVITYLKDQDLNEFSKLVEERGDFFKNYRKEFYKSELFLTKKILIAYCTENFNEMYRLISKGRYERFKLSDLWLKNLWNRFINFLHKYNILKFKKDKLDSNGKNALEKLLKLKEIRKDIGERLIAFENRAINRVLQKHVKKQLEQTQTSSHNTEQITIEISANDTSETEDSNPLVKIYNQYQWFFNYVQRGRLSIKLNPQTANALLESQDDQITGFVEIVKKNNKKTYNGLLAAALQQKMSGSDDKKTLSNVYGFVKKYQSHFRSQRKIYHDDERCEEIYGFKLARVQKALIAILTDNPNETKRILRKGDDDERQNAVKALLQLNGEKINEFLKEKEFIWEFFFDRHGDFKYDGDPSDKLAIIKANSVVTETILENIKPDRLLHGIISPGFNWVSKSMLHTHGQSWESGSESVSRAYDQLFKALFKVEKEKIKEKLSKEINDSNRSTFFIEPILENIERIRKELYRLEFIVKLLDRIKPYDEIFRFLDDQKLQNTLLTFVFNQDFICGKPSTTPQDVYSRLVKNFIISKFNHPNEIDNILDDSSALEKLKTLLDTSQEFKSAFVKHLHLVDITNKEVRENLAYVLGGLVIKIPRGYIESLTISNDALSETFLQTPFSWNDISQEELSKWNEQRTVDLTSERIAKDNMLFVDGKSKKPVNYFGQSSFSDLLLKVQSYMFNQKGILGYCCKLFCALAGKDSLTQGIDTLNHKLFCTRVKRAQKQSLLNHLESWKVLDTSDQQSTTPIELLSVMPYSFKVQEDGKISIELQDCYLIVGNEEVLKFMTEKVPILKDLQKNDETDSGQKPQIVYVSNDKGLNELLKKEGYRVPVTSSSVQPQKENHPTDVGIKDTRKSEERKDISPSDDNDDDVSPRNWMDNGWQSQ